MKCKYWNLLFNLKSTLINCVRKCKYGIESKRVTVKTMQLP